jgi:hypothetical protein
MSVHLALDLGVHPVPHGHVSGMVALQGKHTQRNFSAGGAEVARTLLYIAFDGVRRYLVYSITQYHHV